MLAQAAPATMPLIEARNVTRILPGIVPTTLVHDINLSDRRQRIRRDHRAVRLRQILAALSARPARPADLGRGADPRPRHRAYGRAGARPHAAHPARLRVPVPFPAAGIHHSRQRHAADARARAPVARSHARRARAICSPRSALPITCTSGPTSFPAASASAWRWRARSPTIRRSSSPTSRPARSIRMPASRCSRCCSELVDKHGKTVVAVTHDLALGQAHAPADRTDGRRHRRRRAALIGSRRLSGDCAHHFGAASKCAFPRSLLKNALRFFPD